MNVFTNLVINHLKIIIQKKQIVITLFIIPLMMFFLLGMLYNNIQIKNNLVQKANIIIVDKENSILSKMLVKHFEKNDEFTKFINIYKMSEEEAKNSYQNGDITSIVTIPEDFSQSLLRMENKPFELILNPNELIKSTLIKNVFTGYTDFISAIDSNIMAVWNIMEDYNFSRKEILSVNDEISYDFIMTALNRNKIFEYNEIDELPITNAYAYYSIGIIIMFIFYTSLIGAISLLEDKNKGVLQRISVTSTSLKTYFLARILSLLIIMVTQILMISIPMYVLAKDYILIYNYSDIIIFLIIVILLGISISLLLAVIIYKKATVMLIGNIFIFTGAILGGSLIPIQFMPESLKQLSKITPNYWCISGTIYLLNNYTLTEIYEIVMILICVIFICSIFSIYLLNYKLKNR